MRKRILSILLTLCMLLCFVPTAAFAEGGTASADITGTGTADDPYLIYTAQGLKTFRDITNGANGHTRNIKANATLMNDIVLNDGTFDENGNYTKGESGRDAEMWTPIASYDGTFDGGGYAIRGLYVNSNTPRIGLFGLISGIIRNLTVTGLVCSTQSTDGIGGIASEMYGGSIINCCNACIVVGNGYSSRIGGIVGYQMIGVISNCYNIGKVKAGKITGGIVGYQEEGVISNCYNTGTVTSGGEIGERIGGISGYQEKGVIGNCYNIGSVKADDDYFEYIGGIVGENFASTVTDCYYLTGTAEKSVGVEKGEPAERTEAKPKAEFADGTVLTLLQNGDTNSPWEKCGYLNAAGMIVPLLNGQTSDTFPIYTAEDLKQFRDMVYGGNTGICAKLMNDIVLNDGTFDENGNWSESGTPDRWTPIGDSNHTYAGTFDGGGHTIRGLYVKGASYAGLFGNIDQGTVKNVTVTGYVEGAVFVGGIVGYGSGATVIGCTNAATVNGGWTQVGGIVGYLFNGGNVRNCANLGSVRAQIDSEQDEIAYVGGIAGYVKFSATIADCYNAGSIAIQDSGTGYDNKYISSYLGGIIGQILVIGNPCDISNCYSVGSLTCRGSASAEIYGIAGNASMCVISNCYYLTGTANNGGGGEAKSKEEFANGTVLTLLKGDRTDSPWADECQYLAAAGMTLPLLSWQTADAHTHDYQWKYDNTEHWKECSCGFIEQDSKAAHKEVTGICTNGIKCACDYEMYSATGGHSYPADWTAVRPGSTHEKACTNPGCGVRQSNSCTGGTATCTEQAMCEVCGEKYGTTNPNNHSYEWQSENGRYWQKCKLCDFETDKKDIPTITVTGSDKVCRTQDYKFSFTLPEGATDAEWGYEFINLAGGPITPTLENGRYYGVMDSDYYSKSENSFKLIMSAKTADGFEFRTEKIVTIPDDHTGGTATCKDKAVCEVCGESYGELNANNHANLKHIDAKAATKTSEGNIEYWYCEDCGKYFADKDGNKEITKADTVTEKLPDDSKSPQTGDTSNLALWIALLFISGGAVTATTVIGKKKRHS